MTDLDLSVENLGHHTMRQAGRLYRGATNPAQLNDNLRTLYKTISELMTARIREENAIGNNIAAIVPDTYATPSASHTRLAQAIRKARQATGFARNRPPQPVDPTTPIGTRVRIQATTREMLDAAIPTDYIGATGILEERDGEDWYGVRLDNRYFWLRPAMLVYADDPEPAPDTPPATLEWIPGARVRLTGETAWLEEDDVPEDIIGAFNDGETIEGVLHEPHDGAFDHPGWDVNLDGFGTWWIRTDNLELIP